VSWNTITTEHVLEEFTEAERAAFTAAQDAVDNLSTILGRVIGMARGMISAGGNALGDAGTVPDQVALDVISISRYRLIAAVPKLRALATAERKSAHDDAMKRLENIASGDVKVESATASGATAASAGAELIREPGDNPFTGMGST
jgi:phage gp36-like protein